MRPVVAGHDPIARAKVFYRTVSIRRQQRRPGGEADHPRIGPHQPRRGGFWRTDDPEIAAARRQGTLRHQKRLRRKRRFYQGETPDLASVSDREGTVGVEMRRLGVQWFTDIDSRAPQHAMRSSRRAPPEISLSFMAPEDQYMVRVVNAHRLAGP
ncbi:hypothetical protein [Palleronia pelagia]|uniref:hypothetical protein n=1 Tax=Palleronia pelagia TaxID=387096 RepID=UPI002E822E92|nr:hypothetical protein [Palleronia pelagia]